MQALFFDFQSNLSYNIRIYGIFHLIDFISQTAFTGIQLFRLKKIDGFSLFQQTRQIGVNMSLFQF